MDLNKRIRLFKLRIFLNHSSNFLFHSAITQLTTFLHVRYNKLALKQSLKQGSTAGPSAFTMWPCSSFTAQKIHCPELCYIFFIAQKWVQWTQTGQMHWCLMIQWYDRIHAKTVAVKEKPAECYSTHQKSWDLTLASIATRLTASALAQPTFRIHPQYHIWPKSIQQIQSLLLQHSIHAMNTRV